MQDQVELRKFYDTHREQGSLVLCTLVRKNGSAYRGLGAKKIVAPSGLSCGMLSGGCLEASIEKMGRERYTEMPFIASFSTLAEEDRLMGYQTGCQGVIDILFEQMEGADLNLQLPFGSPALASGVEIILSGAHLGERRLINADSAIADKSTEVLFEKWIEPVHLVILGCGADADAYLPLAKTLGWSIQFLDYRRDLAFPERFLNENVQHVPLEQLASRIPQGPQVAVVLMTHNYEADMEILRAMNNHRIGYLGCLGPAKRFQRLQDDILKMYEEKVPMSLVSKASAPAGLFTHSRSPNEIALSVVAQIQEKLVQEPSAKGWSLILAAGASSRFGGPKALAQWHGETFIARALKNAQTLNSENVMTVTGGHAESILPALGETLFTHNPNWQQGMGTSIAAGVQSIRALDSQVEWILILPVDQPLVTPEHLNKLIQESQTNGLCTLTMNGAGVIGAPAVLPKRFFDRAQDLNEDRGLKSVLKDSEMTFVYSGTALQDVDSEEDLRELVAQQ
jgi:xanthine/CO dehydrogenase XdhC/CoxF family maturation factor/CTP:molybdopterin cytidylyltransferase MocA